MRKGLLITVIIVLILALLAGCFWYFCIYQSNLPVEAYVLFADYCAREGHDAIAAKYYAKAYARTPENFSLAISASDAYRRCENFTKAEYMLAHALSLDPGLLDGYLALSSLYVSEDKLLDAEQLLSGCADPDVKAQLDSLRPYAPLIQPQETYSMEPVEISLSYSDGLAYYSLSGEYPTQSSAPYQDPILLDYGVTELTAIVVGENGLVSPLSAARYTVCGEIAPAQFPDHTFEEAVRSQLDKESGDELLTSELWPIASLTLPEGVRDLTGLSEFVSLTALTLKNSPADLSVLSALPQLQSLDVSGCRLDDAELAAIGTLTSLTELRIRGCGVSSLDTLRGLNRLEVLDVADNAVADLTVLAAMPELTELHLDRNAFTSVSPLASAAKLSVLSLAENPLNSLGALSSNLSLTELNISGCGISDLSPLENKQLLAALDASSNRITDFSCLTHCIALRKLVLAANQITDASPTARMTQLLELDLSENQLEELPAFPEGAKLQVLDLSKNRLESVDALAVLDYLSYLNVTDNRLTDLSALSEMSTLSRLDAMRNPIPDASALEEIGIAVSYDPEFRLPEPPPEEEAEDGTDEETENDEES